YQEGSLRPGTAGRQIRDRHIPTRTAGLHLECQVRPFPPLSKNKTFHFAGILESIISLPRDHSCRVFPLSAALRRAAAHARTVSVAFAQLPAVKYPRKAPLPHRKALAGCLWRG